MTVMADDCAAMRRRSETGSFPGAASVFASGSSADSGFPSSILRVMRLRNAANGAFSFTRSAWSPSMSRVPKKCRSRNCSKENDRTAARMPKNSGLTKTAASRNRTRIRKTGMNPCVGVTNDSVFDQRRNERDVVDAAGAGCAA